MKRNALSVLFYLINQSVCFFGFSQVCRVLLPEPSSHSESFPRLGTLPPKGMTSTQSLVLPYLTGIPFFTAPTLPFYNVSILPKLGHGDVLLKCFKILKSAFLKCHHQSAHALFPVLTILSWFDDKNILFSNSCHRSPILSRLELSGNPLDLCLIPKQWHGHEHAFHVCSLGNFTLWHSSKENWFRRRDSWHYDRNVQEPAGVWALTVLFLDFIQRAWLCLSLSIFP